MSSCLSPVAHLTLHPRSRCASPAQTGSNETLKRRARTSGLGMTSALDSAELDPSVSFVCGASSGAASAFLTTPSMCSRRVAKSPSRRPRR